MDCALPSTALLSAIISPSITCGTFSASDSFLGGSASVVLGLTGGLAGSVGVLESDGSSFANGEDDKVGTTSVA